MSDILNLNFTDEREQEAFIADIRVLQTTSGWSKLCKILDMNINQLTESILNKNVLGDKVIASETQLDSYRHTRNVFLIVRNLPDDLVRNYQTKKNINAQLEESRNLDPYAKSEVPKFV